MKKLFALILSALMLLCAMSLSVFAADESNVYVTISDSKGKLVLAQEKVTVTDVDEDGALTINDALWIAHEMNYEGGAEAGYEVSVGEYGLSMNKLWGTANGGSYGYYINNVSAWSLTDAVSDGDHINAFVYTDLTAWSDTYCYFDVNTASVDAGENIELTLSASGYDAEWNPITVPVAGATITVNGTATEAVTDENGKAAIKLAEGGVYVISAISETQTLVPPVCTVTVAEATPETTVEETTSPETNAQETIVSETEEVRPTSPQTGDSFIAVIILLVSSVIAIAAVCAKRKNNYAE